MTLQTRATLSSGEGSILENEEPFQYEVLGLPAGYEVWINNFPGARWRIMRRYEDKQSPWSGYYKDLEQALSVIEREFAKGEPAYDDTLALLERQIEDFKLKRNSH